MAQLKRMIEIGIDARGAKVGSKEIVDSLGKVVQETGEATKELKRLDSAIDELKASSGQASSEVHKLDKVVDQLTASNTELINKFDRLESEFADVSARSRTADQNLHRIAATTSRVGNVFESARGQVLAFVGGISALATARRVVNDLASFEAALIGVGKTADLEGEALNEFGNRALELAQKGAASTKSLLAIGQSAGQLGVRGSDDLIKFIEVINQLGTATNLQGEEAATTLARILNVTGEGVSTVDRLGAAIVGLGNNSAATEKEIASTGEAVAQATSVFGISSAEALGYGAALASIGVESRLAGSTIGRAMREIDAVVRAGGEGFERLSEVVGMSGEEFEKVFRGNAAEGLIIFLRGIQRVINSGGDAASTLAEFGLQGDEVLKVLPVLAQRVDYLADRVKLSNEEYNKNTALTTEYAKFAASLDQQLKSLGNTIQVSVIASLKEYIPTAISAIQVTGEAILILSGLKVAAADTSSSTMALVEIIRIGTTALIAFGAVKVFFFLKGLAVELFATATAMNFFRAAAVSTAITMSVNGPFAAGMTASAFAVRGLGLALRSVYVAIGPAGWVIIGITAIAEAIRHIPRLTDEAIESLTSMKQATVDLSQSASDVESVFIRLARAQQLNDLGAQIQQIQALANAYESAREQIIKTADLTTSGQIKDGIVEIPTVDVEQLRRQFGEAGKAALDAYIEQFRKTDAAKKINELPAFAKIGDTVFPRDFRAGLGRGDYSATGGGPPGDLSSLPKFLTDLQAADVRRIPAVDAIRLLEEAAKDAKGDVGDLKKQLDDLTKSQERQATEKSATSFLTEQAKDYEKQLEVINAGDERRKAIIMARQQVEEQAAKAQVTLTGDQVKEIERLAGVNYDAKKAVDDRKESEAKLKRETEQRLEKDKEANQALMKYTADLTFSTEALKLNDDEREIAIELRRAEATATAAGITYLKDYLKLVEEELKLQQKLKKEARGKDQIEKAFRELELERQLIGKTNDERERASALLSLQTTAEEAYGESSEKVTTILSEYAKQLKELDDLREKDRGREQLKKINEELDAEIESLRGSNFERKHATEIANAQAAAERQFGKATDESREATELFIQKLKQKDQLESFRDLSQDIGDAFANTFEDLIFGAKSVEEAFQSMVQNIARLIFQELVSKQIASLVSDLAFSAFKGFSSGYGGARAHGGPVEAGKTYVVGEKGPELVRFAQSGNVIPNSQIRNYTSDSNNRTTNTTVVNNVRVTVKSTNDREGRASARQVAKAIRKLR